MRVYIGRQRSSSSLTEPQNPLFDKVVAIIFAVKRLIEWDHETAPEAVLTHHASILTFASTGNSLPVLWVSLHSR